MVNFGLLLFLLQRFLYKPLNRIMEERRKVVARGIKEAQQAEATRKEAEQNKRELLAGATKEAEGIVEKARHHADGEHHAIVGAAEERASRIVSEAEARAESERQRIVERSSADIATLAVLAAEKLLREKEHAR